MTTTFKNTITGDEIFNDIHSDKDVKKIASAINTCIFASAGQLGCDPSFKKAGKNILTALFAYLYHYTIPSQQTMANVILLLRSGQNDEGDDMLDTPLDLIFAEMQDIEPKSLAVKQYNKFRMANYKTQQLVLAFCEARLKAFAFIFSDKKGEDGNDSLDEASRKDKDYNDPASEKPEAYSLFAKNLYAYMARENISLNQLSRVLKIPVATIQAWAQGKRLPRAGAMDALCRCLGCKKQDLLSHFSDRYANTNEDGRDTVDNTSDNANNSETLRESALSVGMQILQHPELYDLFAAAEATSDADHIRHVTAILRALQ